jgi:hypothetical protein
VIKPEPLLTPSEVASLFKVERTSESFPHRVFSYVDPTGDCWEWTGALDRNGYGVIGRGVRGMGNIPAHGAVWRLLVGPVDPGLQLDHLCRSHSCVNPNHLEPVTPQENARRGYGPAAQYSRRLTCKYGHPLDGLTTCHVGRQAGQTWRYCKTCARERMAKRHAEARALLDNQS